MTNDQCNHEWIQLTSAALEKRLLPIGLDAWKVIGCKKCGALNRQVGTSWVGVSVGHDLESDNPYWRALARFSHE